MTEFDEYELRSVSSQTFRDQVGHKRDFTINSLIRMINILISWVVTDPRIQWATKTARTINNIIDKERILSDVEARANRNVLDKRAAIRDMLLCTYNRIQRNYAGHLTVLKKELITENVFQFKYCSEISNNPGKLRLQRLEGFNATNILNVANSIERDVRLMASDAEFIFNDDVYRWLWSLEKRYHACSSPKKMKLIEIDLDCLTCLLTDCYHCVSSHRAGHYHRMRQTAFRETTERYKAYLKAFQQELEESDSVDQLVDEVVFSAAAHIAAEAFTEMAIEGDRNDNISVKSIIINVTPELTPTAVQSDTSSCCMIC